MTSVSNPIRWSKLLRLIPVLLFAMLMAQPGQVWAQFGRNKVNYETFDWYYIKTEHFDIYHPKGSYEIAEFAGWEAEEALRKIQKDWGYKLEGRITFVVYPSHNTFQSNNVGSGEPSESTGGFTEFLKNRVVIPYQGSYAMFRHVIHHELTHAVMLRMLYGEGVQSIISGISRLPIPLWYTEGIAEFESIGGWNNESDLYIRDAVVNDYLMPIQYFSGYFYYKGGQAVLNYIEKRYGKEKVGELMRRIRNRRDFNRALKDAIGIDLEELSKRWHKEIKGEVWQDASGFENPEDFAEKITDHLEEYNYINTSPALSPDGDRIVMLSDKDDYMSLYLVNTVTGEVMKKLITGGSSLFLFEQLLWVRPWVDWSPDGRSIAFVAESAGRDVLYTLDVESAEITGEYRFEYDGIFSPSWSPDGKKLVFSGYVDGQSDLYTVKIGKPESVRRLTDDVFSDYDPDWGANGAILFTSDRGSYAGQADSSFQMWEHDYNQIDIYLIQPETGAISQLTNDEYEDRTPTWTSHSDTISFVSDRTGAYNLFMMDTQSGETWAVSNVLTGLFTPSWSDVGTVAFASFFHGGYDIYLYKDPFNPERRVEPQLTQFQKRIRGLLEDSPPTDSSAAELADNTEPEPEAEMVAQTAVEDSTSASESLAMIEPEVVDADTTVMAGDSTYSAPVEAFSGRGVRIVSSISGREQKKKEEEKEESEEPEEPVRILNPDDAPREKEVKSYRHYVFYSDGMVNEETEIALEESEPDTILDANGDFIQRKYELKFTPDIVYATAGYSTFFGFQGYGQMMFSDVLGNHIIFLGTDLYYNFENSNFSLFYLNLPNRYDWGAGVFHTVYFFDYGNIRDRNYGVTGQFIYPISKTRRFDLSAQFINIDRDVFDWNQYDYVQAQSRHFVVPTLSYVFDNSLWGYTGPMNGSRYRFGFTYSPSFSGDDPATTDNLWGVDFKTFSVDMRKYWHIGQDYALALRGAGAVSWGSNPQTFFLGGVSGWINRRFNGGIRVDLDDIYFSGFATPLRGADYYDKYGDRYVLTNAEFRFPLIRQLLFGWPLPFFFYNVRGAIFADAGAAWHGDNFRGVIPGEYGADKFGSITAGYGWGARVNLGFALLKFDMAWRNELDRVTKPRYYVSLGTDI